MKSPADKARELRRKPISTNYRTRPAILPIYSAVLSTLHVDNSVGTVGRKRHVLNIPSPSPNRLNFRQKSNSLIYDLRPEVMCNVCKQTYPYGSSTISSPRRLGADPPCAKPSGADPNQKFIWAMRATPRCWPCARLPSKIGPGFGRGLFFVPANGLRGDRCGGRCRAFWQIGALIKLLVFGCSRQSGGSTRSIAPIRLLRLVQQSAEHMHAAVALRIGGGQGGPSETTDDPAGAEPYGGGVARVGPVNSMLRVFWPAALVAGFLSASGTRTTSVGYSRNGRAGGGGPDSSAG